MMKRTNFLTFSQRHLTYWKERWYDLITQYNNGTVCVYCRNYLACQIQMFFVKIWSLHSSANRLPEKKSQHFAKFHDTTQIWIVCLSLGVWNFCVHFSDFTLWRNQWSSWNVGSFLRLFFNIILFYIVYYAQLFKIMDSKIQPVLLHINTLWSVKWLWPVLESSVQNLCTLSLPQLFDMKNWVCCVPLMSLIRLDYWNHLKLRYCKSHVPVLW